MPDPRSELAEYQTSLLGAFDTWCTYYLALDPAPDPDNIEYRVAELTDALGVVSEQLADAYLLGALVTTLSLEGQGAVITIAIDNGEHLHRFGDDLNDALITTDDVPATLRTFRNRLAQFASAFWVAIWTGMQERARILDDREVPYTVRRTLDERAQHCATCPPKARDYPSWQAMLDYCGGLPADGSDDCGPGCRCTVTIIETKEVKQMSTSRRVPGAITGLIGQMAQSNEMTTALKSIAHQAGIKSARHRGAEMKPPETDSLPGQLARLDKMTQALRGLVAHGDKTFTHQDASLSVIFGAEGFKRWLRSQGRPDANLSLDEITRQTNAVLANV